jgi:hypothetical protein
MIFFEIFEADFGYSEICTNHGKNYLNPSLFVFPEKQGKPIVEN